MRAKAIKVGDLVSLPRDVGAWSVSRHGGYALDIYARRVGVPGGSTLPVIRSGEVLCVLDITPVPNESGVYVTLISLESLKLNIVFTPANKLEKLCPPLKHVCQ